MLFLAAFAGAPAWSQQDLDQLYDEAKKAYASKNFAAAAQKYETILKERPDVAEAWADLGNAYFQQSRRDQASAAYRKAVQLKPQLAGPHFFLGVIAFDTHSYQVALRHFKEAAVREPNLAFVHSYLGYTYYALADYDNAGAHLERAAVMEPGDSDILYHLSKVYSHLAEGSFIEMKRRWPDSHFTRLVRAHVFETDQDWPRANEEYTIALVGLPQNSRLLQKVSWTEAKAAGKHAVDGPPSDDLIDASLKYLYLPPAGETLRREFARHQAMVHETRKKAPTPENYYRAGESYQTLSYLASLWVIEIDPRSALSHQLQAQLHEYAGKEDDAIREYREVLKLQPKGRNLHFLIGSLHWKNQRFAEARKELLTELELYPNHPQAYYELGDIEFTAGNLKEAEAYYLKALKYEPRMVEARFSLEKIYTAAGQYEKSLEQLRAAIKIADEEPTAHYRLAQVYRRLGKLDEAQAELKIFEARRGQKK
jgi:tetratricopeptide (TPR) repeat protein